MKNTSRDCEITIMQGVFWEIYPSDSWDTGQLKIIQTSAFQIFP